MIQRQEWSDFVRYLIVEEYGSIMVDIYNKPQFLDGGTYSHDGRILIWSLYVVHEYRRMGFAKRLLAEAEKIARGTGRTYAYMFWKDSTPIEVLHFYKRIGYYYPEPAEGNSRILLFKDLTDKTIAL